LLRAFAGPDIKVEDTGEIPLCQWRGKLKTDGAYIDGSNYGSGWEFYLRAPVPRAGVRMTGISPAAEPFAKVPYLEIMGEAKLPGDAINWRFAYLVLPPFSAAGGPDAALRIARMRVGDIEFPRPEVLAAPPGLPTRVELIPLVGSGSIRQPGERERRFEAALAAMAKGADFEAEVSRMAPSGSAAVGKVELRAAFPLLAADIKAAQQKLERMRRDNEARRCEVFSRDCMDGQCG
jgi:hypothetical protein